GGRSSVAGHVGGGRHAGQATEPTPSVSTGTTGRMPTMSAPSKSPKDAPAVSVDAVHGMLRGVIDPELGSDIVELGMVRDVAVDGGEVTVTVALTTSGCPLRAQIQKDIRARVGSLPGVDHVSL